MRSVYVNLPSTRAIQNFVSAISKLTGDFELISEHYILDARSMLGIFNLDLTKPVELKIYQDSDATLHALAPFLAEQNEKKGTKNG